MTREELKIILTEAGVADDAKQKAAIDKVLNEHNAEITEAKKVDTSLYVSKADFDKIKDENSVLESTSKATLDKFKDYDSLVAFKNDTIAAKANESKFNAIEGLLKTNHCNEAVIKLLAKGVDLSKVELDDKGGIVKGDELINGMKTENPSLFVNVVPKGADAAHTEGTPAEKTIYTAEQINKMTPSEINAHWDNIKASLKAGTATAPATK